MDVPSEADDGRLAAVRARIDAVTEGGPTDAEVALIVRLLRSFVTRTPDAVDRLAALLGDGDRDEIRDQAHGMKGSAANIGADALAALCGAIEDQARIGDVTNPAASLEEVRAEAAGAMRAVGALADEYETNYLRTA
ncbi:Hpt domain-containing protein [Actinoplanes sp. NPDC051851]|uniref:Hpt domain-containing protein n=1 Tax=Actinoplanes sp. NPDC051851 TaxID=3154753 RepID=UPI00342DC527